ncbi:sucraseferredoxin-like protein [Pochonia chlamydosporia 170]|uniref:Sucraseferredoxin-like protein n=1 Tax=Pochonia chlamydosporia 170 TaxID=1380566 RepID=A0A219APD4_METCM|nr:sucraseferredoxin-like protein [Pochonia chlamydosporia 170]OWT42459.1 sucraseferredoxin-like protein [Pochonia chlamydosporia 170]
MEGVLLSVDAPIGGGVGIYFINHVGENKYSANVMIYRRPNVFGQDEIDEMAETNGETEKNGTSNSTNDHAKSDVRAAQGIWLARVRPEDCENLIKYTVLKGKQIKPESQLRGGFDRMEGLTAGHERTMTG